jgi:hypothetical protein
LYTAERIEPIAAGGKTYDMSTARAPHRGRGRHAVRRPARSTVSRPAAAPRAAASLLEEVAGVVAGVLGSAPPVDQPLMEAGLDSLGGCYF